MTPKYELTAQALGAVLRRRRKHLGLAQDQAARLAGGMQPMTVSWIENGLESPRLATLVKLCNVYGIAPSEIVAQAERELEAR